MTFTGDEFSRHRVRAGWLKAFYLVGFAKFGYRFAYAPALNIVRRQIAEPDTQLVNVAGGVDAAASVHRRQLLKVRIPDELEGALGVTIGRHCGLLPGRANDTTFYDRLWTYRLQRGKARAEFSGDVLEWPTQPLYEADGPQRSDGTD